MRLGIDLDGVVANFNRGWMTRYNREFGASLDETQVNHWDAAADLTHFPHMREFWEWAKGDATRASIFRSLEPYPGALATLDRLAVNHHLIILTVKPRWAIADTFNWLADHHLPTREVHMVRRKWLVPCDIYLDDSPHLLPQLAEHRPEATVCRFVRAWNEPVAGCRDVAGWEEFATLVDHQGGYSTAIAG
jgi:5'(3')-deoxyribonucleotidase